VIQLYDTDAIRRIGATFGVPTLNGGWLAMFALGVLFALPFSVFVSSSIDAFVSKVMLLSSRNEYLQKLLVPCSSDPRSTTTTLALGNGYGSSWAWSSPSFWCPSGCGRDRRADGHSQRHGRRPRRRVVAWALYGGTLGLVYGLILEY